MLRITAKAILCEHTTEDEEDLHDIIENGCFANHLNEAIVIDEDVTLKNLLELLQKNSKDVEYIFGASLGGLPLEPFITEMKIGKKVPTKLDSLIFERICEVVKFSEGMTELIEEFDFYSIAIDDEDEIREYTLEFSPLSYYADLPIFINYNYEISEFVPTEKFVEETDGSLKRIFDRKVILDTMKMVTFYEFLDYILFEISKYGLPEEREETRKNVFGEQNNMLGKEEVGSEKNVLAQIKEIERLKEEAVDNEDYEKSANYRDRINELKEKLKRKDCDDNQ